MGKCSHEDSRISCIDCSSALCSQCLVQCPVGFRCKACVGAVKNPLTSMSWMLVARTLLVCIGIGFAAGWIMPMIAIPFLSCIICYFLGLFIGRWLAKIIDHKMGNQVGKVIVFGLLIGMSFSPYGLLPFLLVNVMSSAFTAHGSLFQGLSAIAS